MNIFFWNVRNPDAIKSKVIIDWLNANVRLNPDAAEPRGGPVIDILLFAEIGKYMPSEFKSAVDNFSEIYHTNDLGIYISNNFFSSLNRIPESIELEEMSLTPVNGLVGEPVTDNSTNKGVLVKLSADMYFVAVHLKSRLNTDEADQYIRAQYFVKDLLQKNTVGMKYGVIVGDFNMHPYEPGLTHPMCFNALMYPPIANEGHWYNPFPKFWSNVVRNVNSPSGGTFHHKYSSYGPWHVLDYAIFSPAIVLEKLLDVELLEKHNKRLFSKLSKNLSDHLPIIFSLPYLPTH